jgi:hypothetical protein
MIGKGKWKRMRVLVWALVGSNAFDSRIHIKYPNKKRKDMTEWKEFSINYKIGVSIDKHEITIS